MSDADSKPRRRTFGLGSMLLVVLLVAIGVGQYVTTREARAVKSLNLQLSDENQKLRSEAGYLTIKDPRKAAVLQLRTLDELTWRWRVYLPPGEYVMQEAVERVPTQGLAESPSWNSVSGGREIVLEASVRKGAEDQWHFAVRLDQSIRRRGLDPKHLLVAPVPKEWTADVAGSGQQETFDPAAPIVLLRVRAHRAKHVSAGVWTSAPVPTTPCDGLLIWIEPKK